MGNTISSLVDKTKIYVGQKILPNLGKLEVNIQMLDEIDKDEAQRRDSIKLPNNNPTSAQAAQEQKEDSEIIKQ
jgi:hypothetical protein